MRMRYLVDSRTVWILALLACVSLLLAAGSSFAWVRANRRTAQAVAVIQRADSLMRDWVSRGCAPRTSSVP